MNYAEEKNVTIEYGISFKNIFSINRKLEIKTNGYWLFIIKLTIKYFNIYRIMYVNNIVYCYIIYILI